MAEDNSSFNKDTLITKPPKKSPILLRMIVLVFAMVCGVYICSICLQQINANTNINTKSLNFETIETPCQNYSINKSQIPYLHYPKPKTFNRAECACNPVRLFAILSMQRSGSGWFETLLNSHINVSSNGEIFGKKDRRNNITSIERTLDRVYNLDFFTSASKNECTAAVGFKWMLNQGLLGNYKGVVEYFNSRGVSAIFLFRRNLLRRMVSMRANSHDAHAKILNGTHKSHVHSPDEAKTLSEYKPTINVTTLVTDLQQMELATKKALAYLNSTRHIILYYEDIVKDRTKLEDVQEFLGLPYMELTSRQVKIHKGTLGDHVKNWDDVKKTLKGTDYERYLRADDLR